MTNKRVVLSTRLTNTDAFYKRRRNVKKSKKVEKVTYTKSDIIDLIKCYLSN